MLKELPDHLMEVIDKPSSRKPTAFYGFSNTPVLHHSNTPSQSSQAEPFISDLALRTRISILD